MVAAYFPNASLRNISTVLYVYHVSRSITTQLLGCREEHLRAQSYELTKILSVCLYIVHLEHKADVRLNT